jgi:hypothetical protein
MKAYLLGSSVLVAIAIISWPVTSAASECEGILGYVQDRTNVAVANRRYATFERFFCSDEHSSFGQTRDTGAKVGILVDNIPVEFGGHSRNSSWGDYQRTLCDAVRTDNFASEDVRLTIAKGNEAAIDAWKQCVLNAGFHFWGEQTTSDERQFVLKAKYIPSGPPPTSTANGPVHFQPTGEVECVGDKIKKDTPITPGGSILNCKRKTDSAVTITLSTKHGPGLVKIRAIAPPPEYVAVQVTTTTTSDIKQGSYPKAEAGYPDPSWTLVGGGCAVSHAGAGSSHALVMVSSRPRGTGWECMAADPPNIPVVGWAKATGVFMKASTSRPSVQLECLPIEQSSGLGFYPNATATINNQQRTDGFVLVSGGCSSAYAGAGAAHATPIVQSYPTPDMSGWACQGADPPFIPLHTTIRAHAVACRIIDGSPAAQAIVPRLTSKRFEGPTTKGMYPTAEAKVDPGWAITGGGCNTGYAGNGSPHAEFVVTNTLEADAWICKGADPPYIPNNSFATPFAIGVRVSP